MSLETCDDGHEQIVWEGSGRKSCPICAQLKEASDLLTEKEDEIRRITERLDELDLTNAELQEQLDAANAWARERFSTPADPKRVVPKRKGAL